MVAERRGSLCAGAAVRPHGRDRWLFTLGLAQAGEFGFVLVALRVGQGMLRAGHCGNGAADHRPVDAADAAGSSSCTKRS